MVGIRFFEFDISAGALERDEVCDTCSLSQLHCPGHLGHVKLPLPVFNPVYFRDLHKLLRGSCTSCHRLLSPPAASQLILAQMQVCHSRQAIKDSLDSKVSRKERQELFLLGRFWTMVLSASLVKSRKLLAKSLLP